MDRYTRHACAFLILAAAALGCDRPGPQAPVGGVSPTPSVAASGEASGDAGPPSSSQGCVQAPPQEKRATCRAQVGTQTVELFLTWFTDKNEAHGSLRLRKGHELLSEDEVVGTLAADKVTLHASSDKTRARLLATVVLGEATRVTLASAPSNETVCKPSPDFENPIGFQFQGKACKKSADCAKGLVCVSAMNAEGTKEQSFCSNKVYSGNGQGVACLTQADCTTKRVTSVPDMTGYSAEKLICSKRETLASRICVPPASK